ncbi:MAG: hypothetical protein EP341_06165 [Sphingomonadales bacterium]|nr:MAG: hypothetical protein EP341_06165 [Sphingomonadales bacterium]
MKSRILQLAATVTLAACTTGVDKPEIPGCRAVECVRIGEIQTLTRDLTVKPLEILEDSRCPIEADCIWEGRVLIRSELTLGHEVIVATLGTSEPMRINGGWLSIAEVAPQASVQWSPLDVTDYHVGFRFAPDTSDSVTAESTTH